MQRFDCRDLAVTAANQEAVDRFDTLTRSFLAHSKTAQAALCACFDADEDLTLAHTARGFFCALLGQRRYLGAARESLTKAKASADRRGATNRESVLIAALEDVLSDRPAAGVERLNRHIERQPLDALSIKISHGLQFMLGHSNGMRSSLETVLPAWNESTPEYGYILGCYGFALEETGDYRAAEVTGRRGVGLAPDDAWGWHGVAHVMEMQGRAREGIVWLKAFEDRLPNVNNFAYHVFWHRALFHLEMGETDEVFRLYDNSIRADMTDDFRDIANGASLLMRLEFDGIDVGSRWEELADLSAGHLADHYLTFADAHYMMALASAGRPETVADMLESVKAASEGEGHGATMMRRFCQPLMKAIAAFASGRYEVAQEALASVRSGLSSIGGSHAQRDVFEQMLVEAALRAGNTVAAAGLLHERLARRPNNLWARKRLNKIEAPIDGTNESSASAIA
ncbi:MAG: tetratricopeptide repeat protein [Pseudomonadota bacterium]